MDFNKYIVVLLAALIISCAVVDKEGSPAANFKHKTEFELFQDYALAACVAHGYQQGDIYRDAVAALNGYRARAQVPLEAYQQVNAAIVKWLAKPYQSSSGNHTEIATCIDLVKSQELADIFIAFEPCKNQETWRDQTVHKLRCQKRR